MTVPLSEKRMRLRLVKGEPRPFMLTVNPSIPRIVLSYRFPACNGEPHTLRLLTYEGPKVCELVTLAMDIAHKHRVPSDRFTKATGGRAGLPDAAGARLALLLWAMRPIHKPSRAALVKAGILAMPDEEVFYWYAKTEGGSGLSASQRRRTALKALRTLLAGD